MTRNILIILKLLLVAMLLAGCMPKSFIDPGMYKGGLKTAPKVEKPMPVTLSVTGLTNGKEHNRATEFWTRQFSKSLTDAQVLVPATGGENPKGTLTIQMDNVGDIGKAAGKGFVTGLTLGLVGSTVTDGYVMKSSYAAADGRKSEHEYQHAVHSLIGAGSLPEGVESMSPVEAVIRVVEDLVAQMLRDLKTEGLL